MDKEQAPGPAVDAVLLAARSQLPTCPSRWAVSGCRRTIRESQRFR
jgi:hypothetical protein